jgi:hypothetical protein
MFINVLGNGTRRYLEICLKKKETYNRRWKRSKRKGYRGYTQRNLELGRNKSK